MASCKVIRRLALLHGARGLCHKQDVHQPDVFQARSSLKLLATLDEHVTSSGKELLAGIKDAVRHEKREKALLEEKNALLLELRAIDQVALLKLKGLNDTRGLFEKLQEDLAVKAQATMLRGARLWEAILRQNVDLRDCIERWTNISEEDVMRQAAYCCTIYTVLSQHIHAGLELAQIRAAQGSIMFQRGPMSPEQVQIFLCIGKAASVDIAEDPHIHFTRPC